MDIADSNDADANDKGTGEKSVAATRGSKRSASGSARALKSPRAKNSKASASAGADSGESIVQSSAEFASALVDLGVLWLRRARTDVRKISDDSAVRAIGYIQQYPLRSVAIGAAAGVVTAMWLSRKTNH